MWAAGVTQVGPDGMWAAGVTNLARFKETVQRDTYYNKKMYALIYVCDSSLSPYA